MKILTVTSVMNFCINTSTSLLDYPKMSLCLFISTNVCMFLYMYIIIIVVVADAEVSCIEDDC